MKRIAILSGKGGTGKTSLTASIAVLLAEEKNIVTADCDVDAPNLALCLGIKQDDFLDWKNIQTSEKAELIKNRCTGCKKCLNVCNFDAISWDNKKNIPIFNNLLCEGCGSCELICPENAIRLKKVNNGMVGTAKSKYGFKLVSGQLKVGESGSGKIVSIIKNKAEKIAEKQKADMLLIDSAAGIGCPVIASVNGADYAIAVTEPTPSALSDMKRSLQITEHFRIPYGIIINKFDLNKEFSKKIEEFADKCNIPILGKMPYSRDFVDSLINMKPIVDIKPEYRKIFKELIKQILKRV